MLPDNVVTSRNTPDTELVNPKRCWTDPDEDQDVAQEHFDCSETFNMKKINK